MRNRRRERVNQHNAIYHQEDVSDDVDDMWEDFIEAITLLNQRLSGIDLKGQQDIARSNARLERMMVETLRALEKIMIDTTALVQAAQRAQKDSADILAVLKSTRDTSASLSAQLQAALDQLKALPVDTTAQEAVIAGVVSDLNKMSADTEAAVAANPAVPDLPPAPPAPGSVTQ